MASFARTRLNDSWLDDSDLDNPSNADINCDSEPDSELDAELDVDDMPLPPEDFYTIKEELFASI